MKGGIKILNNLQRQRKNPQLTDHIGKSSRILGKSEKFSSEWTKAKYDQAKNPASRPHPILRVIHEKLARFISKFREKISHFTYPVEDHL